MMGLLPLFILGAVTFVGQDIPGLHVGSVNPLSGRPFVRFRQADLDGDRQLDLILPHGVLFQRDGRFDPDACVDLPDVEAKGALCDCWQDTLYMRHSHGLRVVRWDADGWNTVLDQALAWPGTEHEAPALGQPADAPRLRFQWFLYDFDDDEIPEIVLAAPDGIRIYSRRTGEYAAVANLDILPPLTLAGTRGQVLWPPGARRLAFPMRQMNCRLLVEGTTLTVVTWANAPGKRVRYTLRRYAVDPERAYTIEPAADAIQVTEPMPNYVRPCRLNDDGRIDFAGGEWGLSRASVLAPPIYETVASLDGGRTFQARRSRSFTPHCSFVDFDGDRDLDMVTEAMGLFDGGVRESVGRFLTGREVQHTLRIYFQDARGKFSNTPDVVAKVTIRFDRVLCRGGEMFDRYLAAELCNITGDFNGDGYRDLVVQDRPGRLAVYLSTGRRFRTKPDVTIGIRENARFAVVDLNGNSQSDLVVVNWTSLHGQGRQEHSWVFFAQGDEL